MKHSMVTAVICLAASILLLTADAGARSINDGLGTTGFVWLKTVADAEIASAGETLGARSGPEALLVHPAAVAGIDRGMVKMSYVSHYVDTQYGYLGYAGRVKGRDIGIKLSYVNYGEFIRTSNAGERIGTFDAGDMGITFNLGRKLRDDLKVGAAVSYMTSSIEDYNAQAAALDLGLLYTPSFQGLTVGAVLKNLGAVTRSYSSSYDDRLPLYLDVGVKKQLEHAPFAIFGDVIFPNDADIVYAVGIETAIRDVLFLRTGIRSRSDIDMNAFKAETDFSSVRTFGFTIALDRYRFSYAFMPDDAIEDTHKVTLGYNVF